MILSREPTENAAASLLTWYRRHRRDLPWRETRDPYRIWVSEVMLQQTRVETVIPYYRRFLARFPTLEDLADGSEDEVLALWSGLGYYRRARSLLAGARWVMAESDGRFPRNMKSALKVPGVGPYTASAVLSIAYGEPHPVVDGNVERVVSRLIRLTGDPRRAAVRRRIRELLTAWMPESAAGDFNQSWMELGATVCTPASPDCPSCPLRHACRAFRSGDPERFPRPASRRPSVALDLELGLLRHRGAYLLERGTRFSFLRGIWLFPLAEPAEGSRPTGGVAVHLSKALGVPVREVGDLPALRHSITYRRITLWPKMLEADGTPLGGQRNFRWIRLDRLGSDVPVSSLCLKMARRLRGGGGAG